MIITINTDASFYHLNSGRTKFGGYAFWITCNEGRFKKSGPIKNPVSSLDCELKAIANSLVYLEKVAKNLGFASLVINTDCKPAMTHIERKNLSDPVVKSIHNTLRKILNTANYMKYVKFKHVKAHSGTKTARTYVNDWCDKEARREAKNSKSLYFEKMEQYKEQYEEIENEESPRKRKQYH